MASDSKRGFVYAMVNPQYPHLIKIGHTKSSNTVAGLEKRAKGVSNHEGVPDDFIVIHAIYVDDAKSTEDDLHHAFKDNRPNSKEFFAIEITQIKSVTNRWQKKGLGKGVKGYIERGYRQYQKILEYWNNKEFSRKQSPKRRRVRSDLPVYSSLDKEEKHRSGIKVQHFPPEGSTLTLRDNSAITSTLVGKKVSYNGKVMTLTKAARLATGDEEIVYGGRYWQYQGETLEARLNRMKSEARQVTITKPAADKDKHSVAKSKEQNSLTDMYAWGIPKNAILEFTQKPSIKAKVVQTDKVFFGDKEMSLSEAARAAYKKIGKVADWHKNIRGNSYWKYDDKKVKDFRSEFLQKNK